MEFMWIYYFLIGGYLLKLCNSETYFEAPHGSINFMVHFSSNIGLCSGFMVSRNVAMTAAICVYDPIKLDSNPKSLNIVVGATYRHMRRGIKVQITKILIPEFPDIEGKKDIFMEKAPAVLLLKRKVPDILVDTPIRAMEVQWITKEEGEALSLHEECYIAGWHFHGRKDKIYPGQKFLLQRNLRVQFVYIAKVANWCEFLTISFQKKLDTMGFEGQFDPAAYVCIADGMYGSPLICRGKAVGMMMSNTAQWRNCTGYSNVIHVFSSQYLINYMHCVSSLFSPDTQEDWHSMQQTLHNEAKGVYDYVPEMYDKLVFNEEDDDDF